MGVNVLALNKHMIKTAILNPVTKEWQYSYCIDLANSSLHSYRSRIMENSYSGTPL